LERRLFSLLNRVAGYKFSPVFSTKLPELFFIENKRIRRARRSKTTKKGFVFAERSLFSV
jgi:CRISPR/Cas system endoribonuclease Cas6 (RAMP superfamily)